MENKKIDVLFGVVVIAFLVVTIFLIKDFNAKRTNDYKEYSSTISMIVREKNNKIKILSTLLTEKQKENEDLKNTLAQTRNDLESISKKLAQPEPAAAVAPTPAPASAAAAPAVPAAATK